MVKKAAFKGGLDLKILEHAEFEPLEYKEPEQDASITARNALRFLMMGWSSSWMQFISWPSFSAVFLQRAPLLLKALRLAFQQGFEYLFNQLNALELNEQQHEQVQLYLSNCLSLLPYADLTPYESIKIPQFINNGWELVEYYVSPIELTRPQDIVNDSDRVFAYGLQPLNHHLAQSHLIFMGTTYPAGQGFLPQIASDFKAFDTVGNTLYKSGRQQILQWLEQQKGKIHVCGVSLGGALSLLLALDQGERIERVDALNPPGLANAQATNEWDRWDGLASKPLVVVQRQAHDPVSIFGIWKKDWEIVHVTPPVDKRGPNPFFDHFLNYAGFAESEFSYSVAEDENAKRKFRNFWLFSLGRGLIYYAIVWPYSVLIRPTAYYVYQHWHMVPILFATGMTLSALALLSSLSLAPFYLLAGTAIAALCSYSLVIPWLYKKIKHIDIFAKETQPEVAKLHDPKLPRNPELDIYNNSLNTELTYGQINTYYTVMRGLVKQKEFVPTNDRPYTHNKELTKRALLLASTDLNNHDKKIPLCMSKAKIINVKRVLDLTQKIGFDNKEELKEAVSREYRQYCLGK